MGSIPLPELSVQPPANPLDQYSKIVGLRNLMQQSQYLPQQEAAQLAQSQATTGETQARTRLAGAQATGAEYENEMTKRVADAWSAFANGEPQQEAPQGGQTSPAKGGQAAAPSAPKKTPADTIIGAEPTNTPSAMFGATSPSGASVSPSAVGMDPDAMYNFLIAHKVPPPMAAQQTSFLLDRAQKIAGLGKDQMDMQDKVHTAIMPQIASIISETDPDKRDAIIAGLENEMSTNPLYQQGLDPTEQKVIQALPQIAKQSPDKLPMVADMLKMSQKLLDFHKAQADTYITQVNAAVKKAGVDSYDDLVKHPEKQDQIINSSIPDLTKQQLGYGVPNSLTALTRARARTAFNNIFNSTQDVEKATDAVAAIAKDYADQVNTPGLNAAKDWADIGVKMGQAAQIVKSNPNLVKHIDFAGMKGDFYDPDATSKLPNGDYINAHLDSSGIANPGSGPQAQAIQNIQDDWSGIEALHDQLSKTAPGNWGSRILWTGPLNKIKAAFNIDPNLAATDAYNIVQDKLTKDLYAANMRGIPETLKETANNFGSAKTKDTLDALYNADKKIVQGTVKSVLPNVKISDDSKSAAPTKKFNTWTTPTASGATPANTTGSLPPGY